MSHARHCRLFTGRTMERSEGHDRSGTIVPRFVGDRAMRRCLLPVLLVSFLLVACGSVSTATPAQFTATPVVLPGSVPATPTAGVAATAIPTAATARDTCPLPGSGAIQVRTNVPPLATRQAATQSDLQTLATMEGKWQAATILNYRITV